MSVHKSKRIKIVFLYAEVIGYTVGMFHQLLNIDRDINIHVVFWDRKHPNSSRFKIEGTQEVNYHPRSSFDVSGLYTFLDNVKPDILFISGWMDSGYIAAAMKYKEQHPEMKVVCGIDDQWKSKIRQHLGQLYYRFFYKKLFDFMWVAGKPQYHFAQRMGYDNYHIISNLYSADTTIFNQEANISKRLVFIGRFDPVKGIMDLLEAYNALPVSLKEEWPLVIIGDGELKEDIVERKTEQVVLKPFMQPSDLMSELMKGGVSCIPSISEQWGVAIHEMAILGYPLILSSECGAASEFLINGYNGYLFLRSKKDSLYRALTKITSLSHQELELYSNRSHMLGQRINPEYTAYSLISVLDLD